MRDMKESIELIELEEIDYRKNARTPEGCLMILEKYLPTFRAKRNIPFDPLIMDLDERFFKLIEYCPNDIYFKLINRYHEIYKKYELKTSKKRKKFNRRCLDITDEDIEPSDNELKALEAALLTS
jgi:hypothetical protein